MALTYDYYDAFLKSRVTEGIETRAMLDVASLGTFPATPIDYVEELVRLRAYILTCLEFGGEPGDVFESKLKQYRDEYKNRLLEAKNAAALADTTGNTPGAKLFATFRMERV
ncbi:hypothetical protein [Caudoviricetes sp.]|nr:hypothetical protein [Caudoviricetes sp.]